MSAFGRRALLMGLGGVALAPSLGVRVASAQPAANTGPAQKTLVVVFLRGGVEGLGMVVPHAEPAYYRERPRLAVPAPGRGTNAALDLDGRFGLHPRLAGLLPLWRSGELAVVHAVGLTDPTRSHFDAQHFLEVGTTDPLRGSDGFLNRALQQRAVPEGRVRAVAMGEPLSEVLRGAVPALAIEDLPRFGLQAGNDAQRTAVERAFGELYASANDPVSTAGRLALETAARLRDLARAAPPPANGASYPRARAGRSLMQLATLLRANVGVEVACVDLGGWDTHTGQGDNGTGRMADLLGELGGALAAFRQDLGEKMRDVLVLTVTEFGRTIAENGTGGTDHGHGSATLVMGGGVRGQRVLGRWPGLEVAQRFEGRDLAVTTDLRDLLSEALRVHLGVSDLGAVFPGHASAESASVGLFA